MFQIEMTRENVTAYFHCGRPVYQGQALKFRTKRDAQAAIDRSDLAGWSLKVVRV